MSHLRKRFHSQLVSWLVEHKSLAYNYIGDDLRRGPFHKESWYFLLNQRDIIILEHDMKADKYTLSFEIRHEIEEER